MPYKHKVAVLGAGLTRFMRRALETPKELAFEAAKAALEDAGLTIQDIDCVVSATAPDAFDGVHMNGEYLADGAGSRNKPYMRTYVGGGSGVMSLITGWYHIASGHFRTCLVVTEEKMSSALPHPQGAFNAIYDQFLERPLGVNLLWIFALEMNRYMQVHGIPMETFARVAQKNKRNGMDHPSAQEGIAGNLTIEQIMRSEVMAWPVHRLMVSPISDGAGAVVLASDDFVRRTNDSPVWIEGVGWCLDTSYWTNRDLYYPRYLEKGRLHGLRNGRDNGPSQGHTRGGTPRPLRLQRAPPSRGADAGGQGGSTQAPGGRFLGPGYGEGDTGQPFRRAPGGGQSHRGRGLDEGVGDFLAASGSCGPSPGEAGGAAGPGPGLGRPDAGRNCGNHGEIGRVAMKPFAGTSLTEQILTEGEGLVLYWSVKSQYRWDTGVAVGKFLAGLKEGKLLGIHCPQCKRTLVPPRAFCELCFRAINRWVELKDKGTVNTFSVSFVNWDATRRETPEVPAVIEIEGASPGMGIMHVLSEVGYDLKTILARVKVGMRVEAVWKAAREREGSITDIRYFKPVP